MSEYAPEEFLGQILVNGEWVDYARGTEDASRQWFAAKPSERRVVDWIDKERVIFPAPPPFRCEVCGMTAHTDDLSVIGRNCSATAFEEAHKMVPTSMSDNPYDAMMPPGPFAQAVDKAVEEVNNEFLNDYAANSPVFDAQYEENAERWRMIAAAKEAAGRHGAVLPVATAQQIVKALRGGDLEFFTPTILANMVEAAIPEESR